MAALEEPIEGLKKKKPFGPKKPKMGKKAKQPKSAKKGFASETMKYV